MKKFQLRGVEKTHLLLPIPQREIDLNKDGDLQHNPGYSDGGPREHFPCQIAIFLAIH